MKYLLIIGAKSDIAKAVASVYAQEGYNLFLAARNVFELEDFAKNLTTATQCKVHLKELDILDASNHKNFYETLEERPEGVISAVGYLGDQQMAQNDFQEVRKIIDTNYTGIVSLFNIIASDFEQRREGFLVGISSVAGDRGRKSNYMYGSAKAAFTAYLSGLRNRLYSAHVHVMTVKPGFVETKMTLGMDLPKILTVQPAIVAKLIYKAQQKRQNTLYVKRIWRWIMLAVIAIPEWKFKRMSL